MSGLEYLTLKDSRDFSYGCLYPWERKPEEKPSEQEQRIYIDEVPPEYVPQEPEQKPYDPYEPKRGVVIIQM